ncbi:hypothetical protein TWF970_004123 [Orbilia oligospora]|uniref:CBM1 domain-containing protein n=1 Tax=Orbilia oligospora TaxID=2813651 RepID=A0A7C8R879_ORBOL|nr:hypothetical protein TWF970_004123 [Orbilia oligospora]
MKFLSSVVLALASSLLPGVQASLNCTVVGQPLEYRSCEYPDCSIVGVYSVGAMIQAACRSDCSSNTNVWFQLYNKYFLPGGARVTGCNYSGIPFAQTGLPYCYEEQARPRPTTCTRGTNIPTLTATTTGATTARTSTTGPVTTRPTTTTTPAITTRPTTTPPPGNCGGLYTQCGGTGWTGATCCSAGTCESHTLESNIIMRYFA